MSFLKDIAFCLKPRCPVCGRGRLFKKHSVTVVDECTECQEKLGAHDVGDGAAVFLIFILGFTVIPLAWFFEKRVNPPFWVHPFLWLTVILGIIALLLPAVKAYIILLEHRHRKQG